MRDITDEHSSTITQAVPAQPPTVVQSTPSHTASPPPHTAVPVQVFSAFQDEVLADLLRRSLIILAVVAVLSLLATWWVAGRALSRIGRVTAAVRNMGKENLHARLALVGPADEVKELGDTFDAMLDRLERSFTDQRRFTAHASHELRTPLAVQRTALEIPLAQGRVPADLEPDIRRALAATERSENLISALLTLARGESGVLTHSTIDLADLARSALMDIKAEAEKATVTLDAHIEPAPVTGDTALLAHLMANLVTNAVRHNEPGGSVRVWTGMSASRRACIEVTNTGPAIGPADLPALFEPFRRGDRRSKGFGLGLSVVRAVTSTHYGTLTACTNTPGGGLTLRVELPPAHT
ncbi:HAMP domain-containing sensor histidine kinase [Streptomyces sp. NPDC048279]|uniref:sensor histidine kinase n=1 Tax=Streptomyces sp. NPDC048279 TaxID=3154714 RepID=UPI003417D23F